MLCPAPQSPDCTSVTIGTSETIDADRAASEDYLQLKASGTESMQVKFWGVRGSTPTPQAGNLRYGGNTSCVEVRFGNNLFVFDCGTGFRSLGQQLESESNRFQPTSSSLTFIGITSRESPSFGRFTKTARISSLFTPPGEPEAFNVLWKSKWLPRISLLIRAK
jgi:hypothetical protein